MEDAECWRRRRLISFPPSPPMHDLWPLNQSWGGNEMRAELFTTKKFYFYLIFFNSRAFNGSSIPAGCAPAVAQIFRRAFLVSADRGDNRWLPISFDCCGFGRQMSVGNMLPSTSSSAIVSGYKSVCCRRVYRQAAHKHGRAQQRSEEVTRELLQEGPNHLLTRTRNKWKKGWGERNKNRLAWASAAARFLCPACCFCPLFSSAADGRRRRCRWI